MKAFCTPYTVSPSLKETCYCPLFCYYHLAFFCLDKMVMKAWITLCESFLPLEMHFKLFKWPSVKFVMVWDCFILIKELWYSNSYTSLIIGLLEIHLISFPLVRSERCQWNEEQFRHFWRCHHLWCHGRRFRIYRWHFGSGWSEVRVKYLILFPDWVSSVGNL